MATIGEVHFRVVYLAVAVGVLLLLRRPVQYPDRPGSRWVALTVVALSMALGSVGLYYFVEGERGSIALLTVVMFAISLCFVGWLLIAVEFATGQAAPRRLVLGLGALLVVHLGLLVTNFFWVHEWLYSAGTTVDASGAIQRAYGPLFWVQVVLVYLAAGLSTVLFLAEWADATGLRRRQAGTLAVALVPAFVVSILWYTDTVAFPFDPTPAGATVGIVVLTWAMYREEFLELAPVGRQTVVEEMTDAMVILDDSDRVVDWNGAAADLFDPPEPTAGKPAREFFGGALDETLAELTDGGRTQTEVTADGDGRQRQLSVTVSPLEGPGDRVLGRVVVVRDISALKRRERQLLRQNEQLEQFASIVSHDLQGPLMAIRGNADAALRTGDHSHIEFVLEATERMDRRVQNLLELARAGQHISEAEPVDLGPVATAAWGRVWTPSAELAVETDRTVRGDPDRLQQLFENLFKNAVEHGSSPDLSAGRDELDHLSTHPESQGRQAAVEPPGEAADSGTTGPRDRPGDDGAAGAATASGVAGESRETDVAATEEGPADETVGASDETAGSAGETVGASGETAGSAGETAGADVTVTVGDLSGGFYVADDGPGIPPTARDRVFERGYTTAEDGTGLGLGIVQQIVAAHGWSVAVTASESGGARFEITGFEDSES